MLKKIGCCIVVVVFLAGTASLVAMGDAKKVDDAQKELKKEAVNKLAEECVQQKQKDGCEEQMLSEGKRPDLLGELKAAYEKNDREQMGKIIEKMQDRREEMRERMTFRRQQMRRFQERFEEGMEQPGWYGGPRGWQQGFQCGGPCGWYPPCPPGGMGGWYPMYQGGWGQPSQWGGAGYWMQPHQNMDRPAASMRQHGQWRHNRPGGDMDEGKNPGHKDKGDCEQHDPDQEWDD